MSDPHLRGLNILIIDDEVANVQLLEEILATDGYGSVRSTTESSEGLHLILSGWPDLVLLDLHMPKPTGYDILDETRKSLGSSSGCPILVFTADANVSVRREALNRGASDFLTKPGDLIEILLRVRNFLEVRKLHKDLEVANRTLEDKVLERTRQLWESNVDVVDRLARASEFRDDQTGEHTRRVGDLSYSIAMEIKLPEHQADLIKLAAPLHDVGKIAISDTILLKPGPLTDEERDNMKRHTTIGAGILSHGKSDLLKIAETIAISHHERWDGKGYPFGIAKDVIPIAGRIVAVADVFDALTHERPYKKAWSVDEALTELMKNSGTQFDPSVVIAAVTVLKAQRSKKATQNDEASDR